MLLHERNGIRCDLCANVYKLKFVYFSIEDAIKMANLGKTVGSQKGNFNYDLCDQCYDGLLTKCKNNLAPKIEAGKIKCDFCTKSYNGTLNYHIFKISKVTVDLEQEKPPNIERNVMDFNVADCCFKELDDKVNNIVKKTKNEGIWS